MVETGGCKPCEACGVEFVPLRDEHLFCSDSCRNKTVCRNRKGRLAASFVEDVGFGKVYERDGGICAICSQAVDLAVHYLDAMGATLDHKIPVAQGGEHSYANVRLAHRGCNSAKGAKMVA